MVEMENVFYNLFSLVGPYYETALPPSLLPCSVLPPQQTILPDETMQPPLVTVTGISMQHFIITTCNIFLYHSR